MKISLTRKIWLTVASIVLIFTLLLLYIIPNQQEKYFLKNFNNEVQKLASTVALGVEIALTDQNFEGVQKAIGFATKDSRLNFVALVQVDTVKGENGKIRFSKQVLLVNPDTVKVSPDITSNSMVIVKRAPFSSSTMNGEIITGFNTTEIRNNMDKIRLMAILVSIIVFAIGIAMGLWLARTISVPVLRIRDAAIKVGAGDLSQQVVTRNRDEIGELSNAFNKMVVDLATAEEKIRQNNKALEETLLNLEEKNNQVVEEKKRSDELLKNILPEKTAEELKKFGKSEPRNFDMVSVMFIDFSSFTSIAETMKPSALVAEIDFLFRAFDNIIGDYPIEKIKTIGDAYLCASGLPIPNQTHAIHIVRAALDIQEFLINYKADRLKAQKAYFQARIGINSGPVVAGIVGITKFAYDIWGDTVNTASRMESHGEVGKVNISQQTYNFIKDDKEFKFVSRGKIQAKGKGEVEMYFVEKSEYSSKTQNM